MKNDEELELWDYIEVLLKRKWLIMIGTFIPVITAGIVVFNMTKIYEVSTSINIGKTEAGFIEGGSIISERIKSIPMRKEIAQKLSLPLIEISGEDFFRVSTRENKDTLVVKLKRETPKPDQAIKILEIVNEVIVRNHQSEIEKARKAVLGKIAIDESRIAITETQMEALKKELTGKIVINEAQIEIKERKGMTLEKQLVDIEREIEALQQVRDGLVRRTVKEVDVVGMIAYFNDLQARLNCAYSMRSQIIDSIPSEIQSYRKNIIILQAKLTTLNGVPLKIESYKENIATLQARLSKIKETEIINPPYSSYSPVKPQKKRTLTIAVAFSFIVLIFLAFFLEYVEKKKNSKR